MLRSRLLQQKQEQYDAEYNARRHSQVGTGDRSERIRTYNFPQGRVTDHRIGLTIHKLDEVLGRKPRSRGGTADSGRSGGQAASAGKTKNLTKNSKL